MPKTIDARAWADWIRAVTRRRGRNSLDAIADELERLRAREARGKRDTAEVLDRAAHEAWLRAKAGGSAEEIAAAVKALGKGLT